MANLPAEFSEIFLGGEYEPDCARNDSHGHLRISALHRERLAAPRLAVRKDRHVKTVQSGLNKDIRLKGNSIHFYIWGLYQART